MPKIVYTGANDPRTFKEVIGGTITACWTQIRT